MYYEFFSKSPLLGLPVLSLIIFMVVFATVIFRIWGERGRKLEREAGALALQDDGLSQFARAPVSTTKGKTEGSHE